MPSPSVGPIGKITDLSLGIKINKNPPCIAVCLHRTDFY